jgi:molybdopterin-guanine dinucleotide biosynthesis protein A
VTAAAELAPAAGALAAVLAAVLAPAAALVAAEGDVAALDADFVDELQPARAVATASAAPPMATPVVLFFIYSDPSYHRSTRNRDATVASMSEAW